MSSPINAQLTGTFTSDGNAYNLSLPSGYTEIELTNLTDIGSTAASTPVMKAWGTSEMADGSAIYATKTNGAATIAISTTTSSNGFTFIAGSSVTSLGPINSSITGITNASPPVVSLSNTSGLNDGDTIILYGTTGAYQLAGSFFTIGSVVSNTSLELSYVGTAPGSSATAGSLRKIPFFDDFLPTGRFITAITKATNCVVTFSVTHKLVPGLQMRFYVPPEWGMKELNSLVGNIVSVNTTTNTATFDIDTTGFTTFTFPSSAEAASGVQQAYVIPIGETTNSTYANNLNDATYNSSFTGVQIGTAVQTSGKEYQWVARRGMNI